VHIFACVIDFAGQFIFYNFYAYFEYFDKFFKLKIIDTYNYLNYVYIHISKDRKKNVLRGLDISSNMLSTNYLSYLVIIFV
jgi:hypothetical protein